MVEIPSEPPENSADVSHLEQRIDELEETIQKMLPSRREAIGMGVAGLAGASLMSGTASAGSAQVGTIGDSNNLVDVEAEDINVSDTINGASVSGAAAGEALTSDGSGGLTFAEVGGGIPPNFTYVDESNNRSFGTTYTNNTGKVLYVTVTFKISSTRSTMEMKGIVDGQELKYLFADLDTTDFGDRYRMVLDIFVPDGSTYKIDGFGPESSPEYWFEAQM